MRVAIYARVSTIDKQDYQRQVEDLKDIIQKNNEYKNHSIDTFTEKISGYKKENDRPKLEELLDILRTDNNYYSCIFVSEISRIGRDPFHTRKVIDELTNLKVPIYIESLNRKTIDKNGDRDGILSIILQVLIEYSDMEAETFKKRSRSGLFNSAKQGKAGGGIYFPYGYLKDDNGMLKIDEEEKKVIEKIFKLYKEGLGIKKISNSLNKDKIPTRTAKISLEKNKSENACKTKWSDKQVHDILQNTIYIGKRRWKGKDRETHIEIEAENLRIISDELFFNCKDIRENKTTRDYRTSYTYLLKDIIYCGKCGRKYFAKYKPKKGGDKVYICSSRIGNNTSCNNDGINIALIESVLFNELISSERVLKYINDASEIITNTKSEIKQLQKDLTIEKEKRIGIDEKITRAYLGYVNHETLIDLYNNTINKMLNQIISKVIREATSDGGGGRGAYIPPMQPGLRAFSAQTLAPFTQQVSKYKSPLVQYDSYDHSWDLRRDQIIELERTAAKIQDYIKRHPFSTFSDQDGNPINPQMYDGFNPNIKEKMQPFTEKVRFNFEPNDNHIQKHLYLFITTHHFIKG